MATWGELAHESRISTDLLFMSRNWRSCASRAYFAAYARVADALLKVPVAMPQGREGPGHQSLALLIGYNLTTVRERERWRLADVVARLYTLRCLADYQPSRQFEEAEARVAYGLMNRVFLLLR